MMDAKLTNSRSRFMSRIQDDKLQFQIEAFRFKQDFLGMVSPLSPQCVIEEQTGVVPNKIRCLFGVHFTTFAVDTFSISSFQSVKIRNV